MSKRALKLFTIAALGLLAAPRAQSADITWNGTYRFEAVQITNSELNSGQSGKAYALHHLVLMPKAVVADGLTIYSRLDILNSANHGISNTGTVYSVAGDVLGSGPGQANLGTAPGSARGDETNAFAKAQRASMVSVTALYASWAQEFGQLVVGRAPLHFGLGTTWNAGGGVFDHYITTEDIVAYKMILGNLSIMPILGKVNEGNLGEEDDVNDYMVQVMYENPETDLALGILYGFRIGTHAGNDIPLAPPTGATTPTIGGLTGNTRADGYKQTMVGLFTTQKAGNFKIGVEADMLSGDTGLRTSAQQGINLNSYGIAGEVSYAAANNPITGSLKLGMVSGDDPGTADTYEGYHLHRNYDVAMLMFNHPLGQRDFMRTGLVRDVATKASNQIDTEAVSNAMYFAPSFQIRRSDNFSWGGRFIYAMLNKDPIGGGAGVSTNLGYEADFNLTYKPYERLTWVTELGVLIPGEAWRAGSQNLENRVGYGATTKAAISF